MEKVLTTEDAVKSYKAHLTLRKKAPLTINRYMIELRPFVAWAKGSSPSAFSARDIELDFMATWTEDFQKRNGRDPSARTVKNQLQTLNSFYDFLERFDFLHDEDGKTVRNPMSQIDAPQIEGKVLTWLREEDDQKLLSCSAYSDRQRVLVFMYRLTGMRCGELLRLKNADVDLNGGSLFIREAKTPRGRREIPLNPLLVPLIDEWWRWSKKQDRYGDLFLTTFHGNPWTAQQAQEIVRKAGERAELSVRLTPQVLRRTFGSDLINRGARVEVVSKLLGHANTAITERSYAELLSSTVKDEFLALVS